jgi:hypothetical protein
MPFIELQLHLANNGDAIARYEGEDKLHTEKGHLYVRSREGQTFDGHSWWPKYIWVRW